MDSEAQKRARKKYQKKNYEFIKVRLKKGQKDQVKNMAKSDNKSINQFCVDKIFN